MTQFELALELSDTGTLDLGWNTGRGFILRCVDESGSRQA